MRIHCESSKGEWLKVTDAGVRSMMDHIATTPHAASVTTSIMLGLTNYHDNPPDVNRRWNCFPKVRIKFDFI